MDHIAFVVVRNVCGYLHLLDILITYLNFSSYQVTASSWLNDLRDQVERTRVLNVVYRSATALGSRLPSIASAKARVAGAGALLRPVSSSTQVIITFFCLT